MASQGQQYSGTDLKILIEMEAPDFSMADDDWEVQLKSGTKVLKTYSKADSITDNQGNYYILVRATDLRAGKIDIVFHALVPDDDWDDGIRNETDKQALTRVVKI